MRAGEKPARSWGRVGLSSASGGNHVPHRCSQYDHHGWGLAVVGEGVWSPWLRAGCGKRRGVPGKASSRGAMCPQPVTISVHCPTELFRGWTWRLLQRYTEMKGRETAEHSLWVAWGITRILSFIGRGLILSHWLLGASPLFSWRLVLLQTLGSPSAHQEK